MLIVGAGAALHAALADALAKHRVFVETAPITGVVESVVVAAPDLILLVGDAAADCGSAVLSELASSPLSSVVPIAILDDDTALDARLRAFRHGAAAVIPRSASVDAIATQVARLAREIPDRDGSALGDVGEATLHELLDALGKELRSGVLSVATQGGAEPVRLVLGSGQPLARTIDDFVSRLKRHIVVAEPLHYEFDEHAGGTIQLLGGDGAAEARVLADLVGLRVLLADDDSARADAVAQELRARGVTVVVTDLEPSETRFARLRQLDPSVLVIGEEQIDGPGYALIRRMRRDTRLRWPSLLVLRWGEVWSDAPSAPAIDRILTTLATLTEAETSIRDRALAGETFDARLESIGPMRLIRALAGTGKSLHAEVVNPRVQLRLDFSEELVVGATGHTLDEHAIWLEGVAALSALTVLGSGRVRVEPVDNPSAANLMATADVALNMADAEPAPIPASIPAPADSGRPPAEPPMPEVPPLEVPPEPEHAFVRMPEPSWADDALPARRDPGWKRGATWLSARLRRDAPLAHKATAGALLLAVVALVALALVGVVRALRGPDAGRAALAASSPIKSAAPAQAMPPTPANATPPAAPVPTPGPAATAEAELPAVATTAHLPGCDALLAGGPATSSKRAAYQALDDAKRELVRGDSRAAAKSYCIAERVPETHFVAASGRARLLLLRHDGKGAEEAAQSAAIAKPDDKQTKLLRGDALALAGDVDGARKIWIAAEGGSVDHVVARSMALGKRSLRVGDHGRAERFFRRAAVLAPDNADAAVGLVRTLLALSDNAGALAWARHAVADAPQSAPAHVLLGDALSRSGDKNGADRAWQKALELDPASYDAKRRLGLRRLAYGTMRSGLPRNSKCIVSLSSSRPSQ